MIKKAILGVLQWLEDRTGLWALIGPSLTHLAPRDAKWWYVFGSATLLCFIIQVVTGVALMFSYVPSAGEAYQSLRYITEVAPLGRLMRGMHYFGASAMVLLVGVHMGQVFLHGSYKFPREMNWVSGMVLLVFTLGMGFTGQLLRWDSNAVWSIVVGAEQAGRSPVIGTWLAHFIMAGDNIGGATLGRFFALHVFILPALVFAGIGLHLLLVMRHGIAEMPKAGQVVEKETYRQEYHDRLEKTGVPFWQLAWRDSVFSMIITLVIVALAWHFGPPTVDVPPDPSILDTSPAPDFYLLWYFAVLALANSNMEDYIILGAPLLIGIMLFVIPFLSPTGERHPSRRPWAVLALAAAFLFVGAFWVAGIQMNWTPNFHWKPLTEKVIGATEGPVYRGAQVFQAKSCIACHLIEDDGGKKGPDLSYVGDRLTYDQMVIRINTGGVNMPAFAGNMTSSQLTDLVAFLQSRKRDWAVKETEKKGAEVIGTH